MHTDFQHRDGRFSAAMRHGPLVFTYSQGPRCEEWDVSVTCSETHICTAVRLSHLQAIYPEESRCHLTHRKTNNTTSRRMTGMVMSLEGRAGQVYVRLRVCMRHHTSYQGASVCSDHFVISCGCFFGDMAEFAV